MLTHSFSVFLWIISLFARHEGLVSNGGISPTIGQLYSLKFGRGRLIKPRRPILMFNPFISLDNQVINYSRIEIS